MAPDGAGEDVIVAVLDTGLWMEGHPSFDDQHYWAAATNDVGRQSYGAAPKHWQGTCMTADDGTQFPCK